MRNRQVVALQSAVSIYSFVDLEDTTHTLSISIQEAYENKYPVRQTHPLP